MSFALFRVKQNPKKHKVSPATRNMSDSANFIKANMLMTIAHKVTSNDKTEKIMHNSYLRWTLTPQDMRLISSHFVLAYFLLVEWLLFPSLFLGLGIMNIQKILSPFYLPLANMMSIMYGWKMNPVDFQFNLMLHHIKYCMKRDQGLVRVKIRKAEPKGRPVRSWPSLSKVISLGLFLFSPMSDLLIDSKHSFSCLSKLAI